MAQAQMSQVGQIVRANGYEQPLEDNHLNIGFEEKAELYDLDTDWDRVDRIEELLNDRLGMNAEAMWIPAAASVEDTFQGGASADGYVKTYKRTESKKVEPSKPATPGPTSASPTAPASPATPAAPAKTTLAEGEVPFPENGKSTGVVILIVGNQKDKSGPYKSQRMYVWENGKMVYGHNNAWKISTGQRGRGVTPRGRFTPFEMNAKYFSRKFRVILPYGIKFQGGNLIHAASSGGVNYLGQARSHGCVRLHPKNAKVLFTLVKSHGMKKTQVISI